VNDLLAEVANFELKTARLAREYAKKRNELELVKVDFSFSVKDSILYIAIDTTFNRNIEQSTDMWPRTRETLSYKSESSLESLRDLKLSSAYLNLASEMLADYEASLYKYTPAIVHKINYGVKT